MKNSIFNQSQIAKKLGIHPSYVNKILNGVWKNPKLEKKIRTLIKKETNEFLKAA